jgi:hypothetical protein
LHFEDLSRPISEFNLTRQLFSALINRKIGVAFGGGDVIKVKMLEKCECSTVLK